jgi:hypothetical protein
MFVEAPAVDLRRPVRSVGKAARAPAPGAFETARGRLVIGDCLDALRALPSDSVDLVVTSPPYDGQSKYGNGEKYERDWYEGFFLDVTAEVYRTLKPHGSFVLNYRSKRRGDERGVLQYEMIFGCAGRASCSARIFSGTSLAATGTLQLLSEGCGRILLPVCQDAPLAVLP